MDALTVATQMIAAIEAGDRAALEALNAAFRARFAMFFEVENGRIVSQRNYDCFDPF